MPQAPSAAVLAARARRESGAVTAEVRWQSFLKNVVDKVAMTVKQRTVIATNFLKEKVVKNISIPVTHSTGPRGGRVVTDRSLPGEFPRADLVQLQRTIFADTQQTSSGIWDGWVGTPLEYGLILELKMNRSFLKRTFDENRQTVVRIMTGPIV